MPRTEGQRGLCVIYTGAVEERKEVWHLDDRCWVPCLVLVSVPKGNRRGFRKACQRVTREQNAPAGRALRTPASRVTNESVKGLLGRAH